MAPHHALAVRALDVRDGRGRVEVQERVQVVRGHVVVRDAAAGGVRADCLSAGGDARRRRGVTREGGDALFRALAEDGREAAAETRREARRHAIASESSEEGGSSAGKRAAREGGREAGGGGPRHDPNEIFSRATFE